MEWNKALTEIDVIELPTEATHHITDAYVFGYLCELIASTMTSNRSYEFPLPQGSHDLGDIWLAHVLSFAKFRNSNNAIRPFP